MLVLSDYMCLMEKKYVILDIYIAWNPLKHGRFLDRFFEVL